MTEPHLEGSIARDAKVDGIYMFRLGDVSFSVVIYMFLERGIPTLTTLHDFTRTCPESPQIQRSEENTQTAT